MIIIGIDPGSRRTGFGILELSGNQSQYIESGCIRATESSVFLRLHSIYRGLQAIVARYHPKEAAIEQVFLQHNPSSALKLGEVRGVCIAALSDIIMTDYSARQVKQSIVGFGAAKKEQVQHMVRRLLNIQTALQADEADALAIALCHAHMRFSLNKMGKVRKKSSWRDYKPPS